MLERGTVDFGVAISNEKGRTENFSIYLEEYNPTSAEPIKIQYLAGPYTIRNNYQEFIPIRLIVPKSTKHGTYIFNVYVCNMTANPSSCRPGYDYEKYQYGAIQKFHLNLK
jgi:hypothetical protein